MILCASLGASLTAACGGDAPERDQWTVWVATDAPAPQVIDRALIEVLDENGALACTDCRRQLGLPTSASAWPISFGVAASASARAWRVRVRLYRAARAGADGLPPPATSIDRVAVLPAAHRNTDVTMLLHGECIGVASNLESRESCAGPERTVAAESVLPFGRPDPVFLPGTWSRSRSRPCVGAVPDGMVCAHGGMFVLGESRMRQDLGITAATPERFVTVAPFAIDRDEVSVGTVRALARAGSLVGAPVIRAASPLEQNAYCTYLGPDDAANDDQPLSCISHVTATSVCAALGKRLPTEAEWEWVAGNLEAETLYSWGDTGDPCDYADVGLGFHYLELTTATSDLCRARPGQPTRAAGLPRARNERDVTALGVRALVGGLSEWVADSLAPYASACWMPDAPFLTDPRCDDGTTKTIRGQGWTDPPLLAEAPRRRGLPPAQPGLAVGVRCARSQAEP